MTEATRKNRRWMAVLEVLFVGAAIGVGILIAGHDFAMAVPLILAMVGFILLRYVLEKPFHQALAIYLALAAFNYYYFYCAKLTGRNPTDVGEWGVPATTLEKMQKDIVFFVLLFLAGVKLLKNRLEGHPFWHKRLDHPLVKLTLVFMAFTVFRGIFWIFQGDTTFDMLFYLRTNIEFAVLPLLMCTALILREEDLRVALKGILYTLPVVAILGIAEFLMNGSPYERSFFGGQIFSRATATLQNPNNLGGYLATAMGIYILFYFNNQLNRFERWLFWPTIPLGLACLFMTLSRSSILFFFVALTVCLALLYFAMRRETGQPRFKRYRNLLLVYIAALGVSGFVLYRYFDFGSAMTDAVQMYVQSSVVSNTRLYAIFASMGTLLQDPLATLFGYSSAAHAVLSDNVHANVLMRNGVLGFLLYVGIWYKAIHASLMGIFKSRSATAPLYLACFYLLLYQLLYGFTAPINENFPHNMYFWFVIGMLVWLESRPAHAPASQSTEPPQPLAMAQRQDPAAG